MANTSSSFNDVVCGLLVRSGQVLLVHRSATRQWAPNCWDAPGGHLEQGESDLDAIARELFEELGIVIASPAARLVSRLSGSDFDLRVFLIDFWFGEPENCAPEEHDDIGWFGQDEIPDLVVADRDVLDIAVEALRHAGRPGV